MKRTRNILKDSDSMDDLNYTTLGTKKKKKSINKLRSYSIHVCEFCEKIFENKYDYLIHNGKHIIIPLIKMSPRYCTECGLCCFSEEQMNDHMTVKHNFYKPNNGKNDQIKVPDTCIVEDHTEDESSDDDIPLICLMKKKDAVGIKTKNILQTLVMNCKVDIAKFVTTWEYQSNVNESEDGINLKNPVDNFGNSLAFSDIEGDPVVTFTSAKEDIVTECSSKQDSIHFDDLIKPGIFNCKRCFNRFPNRFEVIVHEIVHLSITVSATERCNVSAKTKSANAIPVSPNTTSKYEVCHQCNKEISDKNLHAKTCFKFHCADCDQGFNEKNLLSAHEAKCNGLVVVMCDTCLYLRKRPKHIRYYAIIRFNNLEVKQLCHWCGNLYKEMSQVTLVNRQKLADRIQFEGDIGEQETSIKHVAVESEKNHDPVEKLTIEKSRRGKKRVEKILSNRERLKLIQIRLKSMKK